MPANLPYPETNTGDYSPTPLAVLNQQQEKIRQMESLMKVIYASPQAHSMVAGTATLLAGGNYRAAQGMMQADMGGLLRQISTSAIMYGGAGQNPGAILSGFRQGIATNPMMTARTGMYGSGTITNSMAETATIGLNNAIFNGVTGGADRNITNGFNNNQIGAMIAGASSRGHDFSKHFEVKNTEGGSQKVTMLKGSIEKMTQLLKDTSGLMAAVSNLTGASDMQVLYQQAERLTGSRATDRNIKKMMTTVTAFSNSLAGSGASTAEAFDMAARSGDAAALITGNAGFGSMFGRRTAISTITAGKNMEILRNLTSDAGYTMTLPSAQEIRDSKVAMLGGIMNNQDEGPVLVDAINALTNGNITGPAKDQVNAVLDQIKSGANMTPDQRMDAFTKLRSFIPAGSRLAGKYGVATGLNAMSDDDKERLVDVTTGLDRGVNMNFVKGKMRTIFGEGSGMNAAVAYMGQTFDATTQKEIVDATSSGEKLDFANGSSDLEKKVRASAEAMHLDPKGFAEFSANMLRSGGDLTKARYNQAMGAVGKDYFTVGNSEAEHKQSELAYGALLTNIKFQGDASTSGGMKSDSSLITSLLEGQSGVTSDAIMKSSIVKLEQQRAKNAGKQLSDFGKITPDGLVSTEKQVNDLTSSMSDAARSSLYQKLGLKSGASNEDLQKALATKKGFNSLTAVLTAHGHAMGIDDRDNTFHVIDEKTTSKDMKEIATRKKLEAMAPAMFANGAGAAFFNDPAYKDVPWEDKLRAAKRADPEAAKNLENATGTDYTQDKDFIGPVDPTKRTTDLSESFEKTANRIAMNLGRGGEIVLDKDMIALEKAANSDAGMAGQISAQLQRAAERLQTDPGQFDGGKKFDQKEQAAAVLNLQEKAAMFKKISEKGAGAGGSDGNDYNGTVRVTNSQEMIIQLAKILKR